MSSISNNQCISRRDVAVLCAGAGLGLVLPDKIGLAQPAPEASRKKPILRAIPSSGELLPAIGLGTSATQRPTECWSHSSDPAMVTGCTDVVRAFVASGGKLVDTAPTYKAAESMVGDILADTGLRSKVFLSDKLELADFYKGRNGLDGLKGILQRLHTEKLDLLQVHSPNDPKTIDLGAMREWKAQGFCRYIGITRTADYVEQENDARYDVVDETILKREKPDFIEVDYAIDDTGTSEERVIAAAADAGVGVLIALPLGRGRVFSNALGKALPDWASEFDCTSWAQFFLKWILGNPNVTAAIPGTDKASHVVDNLGAAYGRLPDAAMRKRMKEYLQSL